METSKLQDIQLFLAKKGGDISPLATLPPLSYFSNQVDSSVDFSIKSDGLISQAVDTVIVSDQLFHLMLMNKDRSLQSFALYSAPGGENIRLHIDESAQVTFLNEQEYIQKILDNFESSDSNDTKKEISRSLTIEEACVLSVLIDLTQASKEKGKASKSLSAKCISSTTVLKTITGLKKKTVAGFEHVPVTQSISTLLFYLVYRQSISKAQIQNALSSLESKGLVTSNEKGWLLSPEFSSHCFDTSKENRIIALNKGNVVDGLIETEDAYLILGDVSTLLIKISFDQGNNLEWTYYSSFSLKTYITDFFKVPSVNVNQNQQASHSKPGFTDKAELPQKNSTRKWTAIIGLIISLLIMTCGCCLLAVAFLWL